MSQSKQFLNRDRAESFGEVAHEYDRHRPTYPPQLIDDLVATGARTSLDVGCGTGLLGGALVRRGIAVTGVEPDTQMALLATDRGLDVESGTFENWDRRDRTVDLITFGQSWHWVDPDIAAPKAFELLNPGGVLVLAWNRIEPTTPPHAQIEEVMERHSGNAPMARGAGRSADVLVEKLSEYGFDCSTKEYERMTTYSADDYLAVVFTYSAQLTLPENKRRAMRTDLEALLDGRDVRARTGAATVWARRPA